MANTAQLALPLIMPAQAQKHVTVNEALAKLDAFALLRLTFSDSSAPPAGLKAGQSFFVRHGGEGAWAGQAGNIATYVNGGWTFTQPLVGWRAWDQDGETYRIFDGSDWIEGAVSVKPSGSAASVLTEEFDHVVGPGTSSGTTYLIPKHAVVVGVTGRVCLPLQGEGLSSWSLGVIGSRERYGSHLGTERNSYAMGVTGSPLAYFEPTPLLLSAEQGEFVSGVVRFAVHYIRLAIPRPV